MIGTILIIAGIGCIGTGTALLFKIPTPIKQEDLNLDSPEVQEQKKMVVYRELQTLIDIAVADGVVTKNEEAKVLMEAEKLGIDLNEAKSILYSCMEEIGDFAETRIIDIKKEKGDRFEAYIAGKFDRKYFTLTDWAGDKYIDGIYAASTLHPDLKFRYKAGMVEQNFAVECKYRSNFINEEIEWAKESQLKNYRNFQQEFNMPVFVAIGIGGEPSEPKGLYLVPLVEMQSNIIAKSFLQKFKKHNFKEKNIFYLPETGKLG